MTAHYIRFMNIIIVDNTAKVLYYYHYKVFR